MARLNLRLLGDFEARLGSGPPLRLRARKTQALLAYLGALPEQTHSRDKLASLLWGDRSQSQARSRLRGSLFVLRRALAPADPPCLALDSEAVALEVGAVDVDAVAFRRLAQADDMEALARAVELYRGDLLEGLAFRGALFEDWLIAERERLRELALDALAKLLAHQQRAGALESALQTALRLVALDPLQEPVHRTLMRLYDRFGRRSAALRQYQTCVGVLRRELNVEPEAETKQLYRELVRQQPQGSAKAQGSAASTAAPAASHSSGEVFPPLRPLRTTNLPIPSSSFVGRERELAEAGRLIVSHRLLTLTGPGGSGKTRLAIQLAAEAVAQFPDGVFWVPLQALRDPALVERAVRASLGADEDLITRVGSKRLLVLLDNFEQVVDAAPVVSSLLAGTPHAKVLITSRAPLHLDSEWRYPVEPLPEHDAATLFIERATAIAPGFHPTAVVGEICRRLDGLPLAIELAAARIALLEPDELLARLERRLPLLTSRSHDVPTRQRTLRATIEWSHDLLEPGEQQLFRKLAAFTGSFSVEAAEAVCQTDLDTLESLVEKGLVRRRAEGRLTLLDTIREYALERLDESPEAEEVRRRHAEFFLAVAERANLNAGKRGLGKQTQMHHDIAIREADNVRGALAWTLATGAHALGLAIATSVEQFWIMHDPPEGVRWFARLLGRPAAECVAPEIRADALRAYGGCRDIACDDAAAAQLYEQSLALFTQLGDEHGRAVLLHRLGIQAMRRNEPERARELVEASHTIHERNNDRWGLTQTIGTLGALARDAGEEGRAYELITKSAALAREVAVPWWESGMLLELAHITLDAGRIDEGEVRAREALRLADQMRDRGGRVFGIGLLARVAAERGQRERAGRLWGAVENENVGAPLGGWRRHRRRCEELIRHAASTEFDRGYAEGRSLRLEDAVALALAAADPPA